ncbi:epimerase [Streptomyces sp. NPDC002851]
MKIVIPGGTGQVGTLLDRALTAQGHEVVTLTRTPRGPRQLPWDGRTLDRWAEAIDGSDAVINLAGRSVSCRYTPANLQQMMDSRIDSTRVVGQAIAASTSPPQVWLQMSTATIYAHRFDAANDEANGIIGGTEPDVPDYWAYSVRIAENWERAQQEAPTPKTRKVALRTAMVMSPDRGGVFDALSRLTRLGLGGPVAGGRQYVSWIHEDDFVRAVEFLIERGERAEYPIERDDRNDATEQEDHGPRPLSGPVNLAAPTPLPHREFMRTLRTAWRMPLGLPATRWMTELGAFAMRSDTELLLKSRRVTPGRLLDAGFTFQYPTWPQAAADLVTRTRSR